MKMQIRVEDESSNYIVIIDDINPTEVQGVVEVINATFFRLQDLRKQETERCDNF